MIFKKTTALMLAVLAVLFCTANAQAQLFPNAPWNQTKQVGASSGCPNGQCPTAMAPATQQPGHWSFPGTIESHLEGTHGVATAGMTRQQKLNLHDSLHEGTAGQNVVVSVPRAAGYVKPFVSYYQAPTATSSGNGSSGGGSSGGFGVGTRLPDGSIVTSVGVTLAAKPEDVSMLRIGDRATFRKSLLAAGRKARDSGQITGLEFFLLSAASRNPATLEKMQAAVHEAAIEEGLATTQAIDWNSLIEFIEKLIPIIIKLIELFGQVRLDAVEQYV